MTITYEIDGFQFEADSEEQVPEDAVPVQELEEDSDDGDDEDGEVKLDKSKLWKSAPEATKYHKERDYGGLGLYEDPYEVTEEHDDQNKKALKMNIKDIREYRDKYCGAPIKQKQSSETEDSE